jgi:hypothetical protein
MAQKCAILTYHRITEPGQRRKFYDIPRDRFARQMNLAARHLQREPTPVGLKVTFDDGTSDHMLAAEILAKLGINGIFFIIAGRLDAPGYLRRSEIRIISDLGHDIGSHTMTHPQLPTLSTEDLRRELICSREELELIAGTRVKWFAPPGGCMDDRTYDEAIGSGYEFVRTMKWGYSLFPIELANQPLLTIPILPTMTERQFGRILDGSASFLLYRAKQALKSVIGNNTYVLLRERLSRLLLE